MANRRISELPLLDGTQVAEQDLFTMVHVFEVDPTLKNKKITVSGLKQYLNTYYLTTSGSTVYGSLVVQNNLTTSGLIVSNLSTLSAVIVQNNLTTSGTISGATVTGDTALLGTQAFLPRLPALAESLPVIYSVQQSLETKSVEQQVLLEP
jgi:hypothetical protein